MLELFLFVGGLWLILTGSPIFGCICILISVLSAIGEIFK
jgi:hypothetical protein